MPAAKVGGMMTEISRRSPLAARVSFGPGCGAGSRAIALPPGRAGSGVAVSLPRSGDVVFSKWCKPTATECAQIMPASREARQVQRLSISTCPLMTRPARKDDVPSCTTPLSRGGVQFEEMTLPPASKERAFLTASQPADFMKKPSDNSVIFIRPIVSDIARVWQLRSPATVSPTFATGEGFSLFQGARSEFPGGSADCF